MINDRYEWFDCRFEWLTKENWRKIDHSSILLGIKWDAVRTSSILQSRIKSTKFIEIFYWIRVTSFNHKHIAMSKNKEFSNEKKKKPAIEMFFS